jgi:anti-sigma regulatory factor (Ser/Thr protein kinase)
MDELIETTVVRVVDPAEAAEARRAALAMAQRLGFDEGGAGRVALVATEAATNLVKHGGGGEFLVQAVIDEERRGLELLALDKGPGMSDLGESTRDGVSTAGTRGTGLGAIGRMADAHDIYSRPGHGTAVLARFWEGASGRKAPRGIAVGGVSVSHPGERICGDRWAARRRARGVSIMVADGLGHGQQAAEAAAAMTRIFLKHAEEGPAATLQLGHDALRSTRGAAAAIAAVDGERGIVTYGGVGNIAGSVLTGASRRSMVSHNGTLGHQIRTVSEFTYSWSHEALLVLHSDGLVTHWSLDAYPGIGVRDPSLIAGILYRDFTRGRDDVTVVVARAEALA